MNQILVTSKNSGFVVFINVQLKWHFCNIS